MAALSRQNWPIDPSGKNAFYGNPGVGGPDPTWKAQNLVSYVVPWTGHSVLVHRLVRDSLDRVLTQYWIEIGHDQSIISKYGLADVETYNYRVNRNNRLTLSNHSYGIAIDIAPSHNPNGSHWIDGGVMMPRRLIELFKFEGWRWGGNFSGTKDPMHFEAVHDQHHDQPPVPAPQSVDAAPVTSVPATPIGRLPPAIGLPALGFIEEAAALVARQLIASSPAAAAEAVALRAKLTIVREVADAAIGLLDKVAPIPGTSPAPQPSPPAPPIGFPLPGLPLPPFLQPSTPAAPAAQVQKGITATVFGGGRDRNTSAYDRHLITDSEPGCALPYRFSGPRPLVSIQGPKGTATVPIVDVGPWNTDDDYWAKGARPQAESGTDKHGRHTNLAGIDLTPATARAVGVAGKGKVDWWFGDQSSTGETKMATPSPVASTMTSVFTNWKTSALGIGALLTTAGHLFNAAGSGDLVGAITDFQTVIGLLAGFTGLLAKDHNVTGGSVQQ